MKKQRPRTLKGTTTKYNMCGSLYVTVNVDEKGNPYEIFCNCAKLGTCRSNIEALARTISKMLQVGDVEEAIDSCSQIRCPAMERKKGKATATGDNDVSMIAWSCPDAIAREVGDHLKKEKK